MTGVAGASTLGPRFDWMQATVREDAETVAHVLGSTLGAGELDTGKGLHGYAASYLVKRRGETLARVLWGGKNGNPHVIASSAATDEVLPVVRAAWAGHHLVTRLDSAQDFDAPDAFVQLRALMLAQAERSRLSVQEVQSTVNGVLSRTVYLGSPSSRVRVRLYEKGQMMRQQGGEAPEGWVRLEAQLRPDSPAAREAATDLDPLGAWGLSSWTRDLAAAAFGADVPRVHMQVKREPDYARALFYLERQYGDILRRALAVEGSWDAVGRLVGVLDTRGNPVPPNVGTVR